MARETEESIARAVVEELLRREMLLPGKGRVKDGQPLVGYPQAFLSEELPECFPGRGDAHVGNVARRGRGCQCDPCNTQRGIARAAARELNRPLHSDDRWSSPPRGIRQGPALQGAGGHAGPGGRRFARARAGRKRDAPGSRRRHRAAGGLSVGQAEVRRPGRVSLPGSHGRPARPRPVDGRLLRGAPRLGD